MKIEETVRHSDGHFTVTGSVAPTARGSRVYRASYEVTHQHQGTLAQGEASGDEAALVNWLISAIAEARRAVMK